MGRISAATVLYRVPELDIALTPTGEVEIHLAGSARRFGPAALGLLDTFTTAKTLGAAIQELRSRIASPLSFDDVLETVLALLDAGVLAVGEPPPRPSSRLYPFGLYDSPGVHVRMLQDQPRRSTLLRGVREVVQAGDVVLDLGTGCGVLAVAAVQAGARHVYAIEPSGMAAYAAEVFRRNGVDSNVTVVRGWSQQLDLPERADVLMTDLVASDPLQLSIVEVTRDAVERLLRPGARLLPHRVDLEVALVELPADLADSYWHSPRQIRRWQEWYGIDFSPLLELGVEAAVGAFLPPAEALGCRRLSATAPLWRIELGTDAAATAPAAVEIEAVRQGVCGGLIGISRMHLGGDVSFAADPATAGPAPHWMVPLWIAPQPFAVHGGDRVGVRWRYLGRGRTEFTVQPP